MNYKITSNHQKEIEKRSIGVPIKFKILGWVLNTFFKDWTIVKDIIVFDNEIITKNLGPIYGSPFILKTGTLRITGPKGFKKEYEKMLKLRKRKSNKV